MRKKNKYSKVFIKKAIKKYGQQLVMSVANSSSGKVVKYRNCGKDGRMQFKSADGGWPTMWTFSCFLRLWSYSDGLTGALERMYDYDLSTDKYIRFLTVGDRTLRERKLATTPVKKVVKRKTKKG